MNLTDRILIWAMSRKPDLIIGGNDNPYLVRWFLIPRNRFFNIYVHQFLRSDDDRAHHDHPWLFNASWLLHGEYMEYTIHEGGVLIDTYRKAGDWKFRWGRAPHRIALFDAPGGASWPCWTVFITGPRVREWGFYCMERGWIHWRRLTDGPDGSTVGKGCDA